MSLVAVMSENEGTFHLYRLNRHQPGHRKVTIGHLLPKNEPIRSGTHIKIFCAGRGPRDPFNRFWRDRSSAYLIAVNIFTTEVSSRGAHLIVCGDRVEAMGRVALLQQHPKRRDIFLIMTEHIISPGVGDFDQQKIANTLQVIQIGQGPPYSGGLYRVLSSKDYPYFISQATLPLEWSDDRSLNWDSVYVVPVRCPKGS